MVRDIRRRSSPKEGFPLWLISYADLITLLLCCFLMILSFSTVNNKVFSQAAASIQNAFGVTPQILPLAGGRTVRHAPSRMESTARKLQSQLQVEGIEKQVKIEYDALGGLKISLPSAFLFDAGNATLKPETAPVFRNIATSLRELPDTFVEIRGHTDTENVTDTVHFRDNYDLSYFRADAVARQLSGAGGVPIEQFEIVACGPNQPLATNNTEEGRNANRRVEIFVRGLVDKTRVESLREGLATPGMEAPAAPAVSPRELNTLR